MKGILIAIGDELLIGQVLDTNSHWLADKCTSNNIEIVAKETIGDTVEEIVACLRRHTSEVDVIITTGGMGPTNDDFTAEALSVLSGTELEFHQSTWDRMAAYFSRHNKVMSPTLGKQCMLPKGIGIMENDMGTAPGLWLRHGKAIIISMPGVPYEMRHLFEDHALPMLLPMITGPYIRQRTLLTAGKGESDIADLVRPVEDALPAHISLAYLPDINKVRLRLTGYADDTGSLESALQTIGNQMKALVGQAYYGEGTTELVDVLRDMMTSRNMTLGLAESCTGGRIADTIVARPNASQFFNGSIVSYANEAKHNILGVNIHTLMTYGAVSEQVVKEMAEGALKLLQTDLAVSVSGIAGPDGGTEDKPVGTYWVGIAQTGKTTTTHHIFFHRDRARNIAFITSWVLNKIRLRLMNDGVDTHTQ